MILVADSGSTKTTWCTIDKNGRKQFISTNGINPFFRASDDIYKELKEMLIPHLQSKVDGIFFYGAGIINIEKANIVRKALETLFPSASIEIENDLLAAARATLGKRKGIACILGTGSNSCHYNGKVIVEKVPPLGFILGDEGSGAVLGRKLLGSHLKGLMPENLTSQFSKQFPFKYHEFLENVYKNEKPNKFLAQFVPFLKENIEDDFCAKLVRTSFNEFISRNILQYKQSKLLPVCFVGSVAYYFQTELKEVCEKHELTVDVIIREPIENLILYHTN